MAVNPTDIAIVLVNFPELLTTFLLTVHLLAMNIASAGPLVCIWLGWHNKKSSEETSSSEVGRRFAWWSVSALLIGILTGGLLVLTTPTQGLSLALGRFPASAYWFAGAELAFSLACMLAIAAGWKFIDSWWLAILAVASATNLLYHFPPMMAVIGQIASDPSWTDAALIDRPALRELMTRGEVLALSFHFGMSSIAVAAICLLHIVGGQRLDGLHSLEIQTVTRRVAGIAFAATILQIPIGVWLLANLSSTARSAVMGSNAWASIAFMSALVASLVLLQRLLSAALGEVDRNNLKLIASLTCSVVLLMTITLRLSRPAIPTSEPAIKTASSELARG